MSNENKDIPVNGAGSSDPLCDVTMAANVSIRAAEVMTDAVENLMTFGAAAVQSGNLLSSAMNGANQFIKRQIMWKFALFLVAAFTTGNLIASIVLANKLSQVCGR